MWPFESYPCGSISKKEILERYGTPLPESNWTLVFINMETYALSEPKVDFKLDIAGYFNTREEALSIAKKTYGLRAIAPIIRGNMDDPLRGATFFVA
jgi:hypothetical protein